MLIALTAGVALLSAYLAYRQIDQQQETATILSDINRVNSALSRYGKDSSRDSAMDIFHNLDRVRQQTRHPAGASAEISSLFPLIDDFRLQFQKFVAEADQSRTRKPDGRFAAAWHGEIRLAATRRPGQPHRLRRPDRPCRRSAMAAPRRGAAERRSQRPSGNARAILNSLRQAVLNDVRDNAMQRRLYRILHDAGDFLKTLEKYSGLDESCRRDRNPEQPFQGTGSEYRSIRLDRPGSHASADFPRLGAHGGLFVASTIGAAIVLSRRLTSEILRPIHGLLATTSAIAEAN